MTEITFEILERNGFVNQEVWGAKSEVMIWATKGGARGGGEEVAWNRAGNILQIRSRNACLDLFECKYLEEMQLAMKACRISKEIIP